jgi:hypothetical protein
MTATVDHFLSIQGIQGPTQFPAPVKGLGGGTNGFAILWHSFPIVHPINPATAGLNQGTARVSAKPFNIIIEATNTSPIASAFAQKKILNLQLILTQRIGATPVPLFTIDFTQATIVQYKEASWRTFEDMTALPFFTTLEELLSSETDIPNRSGSTVLLLEISTQAVKTTYASIDASGTPTGNDSGYFNFLTQSINA